MGIDFWEILCNDNPSYLEMNQSVVQVSFVLKHETNLSPSCRICPITNCALCRLCVLHSSYLLVYDGLTSTTKLTLVVPWRIIVGIHAHVTGSRSLNLIDAWRSQQDAKSNNVKKPEWELSSIVFAVNVYIIYS